MVHQEIPVYKNPNLHDEVLTGVFLHNDAWFLKGFNTDFLNDHFLQQS